MRYDFKIENSDGSDFTCVCVTERQAKKICSQASDFASCLITLYVKNPLLKYRDPLRMGAWIKIGHAEDGMWTDANAG